MSHGEALEDLIKRRNALRSKVQECSDIASVLGERFDELGRGLTSGGIRSDFPFESCDVQQAREILQQLPGLKAQLGNLEFRVQRAVE